MTPEQLAILFHDIYEHFAPRHGYETKPETREFKEGSPNANLMIEVCREILRCLRGGRYKVVQGAKRFDMTHTVVDTTRPRFDTVNYESVVQCADRETADIVCKTLNASQMLGV